MKLSKKFIASLTMVVLLSGVAIFIYAHGAMSTSVPAQRDTAFLLEPSVVSSASSEARSSSSPEQPVEHSSSGAPDSWDYIVYSQMDRSADWKQIVKNSRFQLGEPVKEFNEDGELLYYDFKWNTYPHLNGSTVAVPMAVEFARQHLNLSDEQASSLTSFYATHAAYEALIGKEDSYGGYYFDGDISFESEVSPPDLIIATEPSDEELALAKHHNVTLVTKPVCYDAFVFITHKDNPIESLTLEQIQKIYSGEITNWKEVGGSDAPISAYQREKNSGSQTAMENLVMQGKRMIDAPTVQYISAMSGLVEAVADYQNRHSSIGYTYKYYIDNLYSDPNIKTIAIEGIPPTEKNIRSMSYPLSTNYYGVIRGGEENGVGGKFLNWMLSSEGQACIAQAGYIPMMPTN